jgi:hypothetical protein
MFLSPLFRKAVLCCCLALAFEVCVFADANFLTNGGEYSISGPLAGDQSFPQMAITAGGGYLVWEDNSVDGSGQGISAAALDSDFHQVGNRFRVNQNRAGDQERPQVSLLNGGGAAMVWQSRPRTSARHVFARFLSASNTWVTGDIMVNSSTKAFQINPVVATLNNGNVVIAYGSFNQQGAHSMQDVYAQIFSPTGQKIGSEFQVNQFTSFNQRTPAIAPLTGGGFILAWVSEQQRYANSIDIYGRLFDANGSALNSEFLVNPGNTNICANPSVAATSDGGFIAAWGELDGVVKKNGWDVFARTFSAAGVGGAVQPLNTTIFGDQFAPKIATLSGGALATWTSVGQDGSKEGVYGRFLDASGNVSDSEMRVNTTTVGPQEFGAIASDHTARFLAVWSSFTHVATGLDLYAQVYASSEFIAVTTTTNYLPPVIDPFPTDNLGGGSGGPGQPPGGNDSGSNGVPKGIVTAKGVYYGEFYDLNNGVSAGSAGSVNATVTGGGRFTVKVNIGGKNLSASGKLDSSGNLTATLHKGPLQYTLRLQVDLAGGNQITGTISDGNWSSDVQAERLTFGKTKSTVAQGFAGNYTLQIPADPLSSNSPAGDGFASVKIDANGGVQMKGSLADGTKLSLKTGLSEQGYWPLFSSLYSGRGCLVGWLQVTNATLTGPGIVWIKPAGAKGKNYPNGFTNHVQAVGMPFQKIVPGHKAFNWPNDGQLILSGGGFADSWTNLIKLDLNNKVGGISSNKLKLTLTPATGLFKGSILNPDTGKPLPFQGAIFQSDNSGFGYFLNLNQSGNVSLEGAP